MSDRFTANYTSVETVCIDTVNREGYNSTVYSIYRRHNNKMEYTEYDNRRGLRSDAR